MRNFLTLLSVLAVTLFGGVNLSAQAVSAGAWMIGGTAGFASTKFQESDNSSTFFNLSPSVGVYIIDDLAIGLGLSYSSVKIGDNSESSTNVSPYVRYYFINPVFAQAGLDIGLSEGSGLAFNAAVGYSWFLNDNVAVEPQFYYVNYNQEGEFGDYSTFGLAIGIQAFIGR